MRQTRLLVLSLSFAGLSSCGQHATEPAPAPTAGTAMLVATQPPARSTGVLYDTSIWGQFDQPLDTRTVSAQSVFLKLDGQRVVCAVAYEAITRRITLRPIPTLELQRTYTAEFTPSVHTAAGVPLPPGLFFQFTTNSLRRVTYDFPTPTTPEGPLVTLGWAGSQGPKDNLFYEVYAGVDSVDVERRVVPYVQRSVFTRLVPASAWPRGSRVYWAITSENLLTRERLDGRVTSFEVLGDVAALDSVVVRARDHGSNQISPRALSYCNNAGMPSGPNYNAAMHWNLSAIPSGARIVGATVTLVAQDGYAGGYARQQPTLWLAQNEWTSCTVLAPGPPWNELSGLLSRAVPVDPVRVSFSADRLGAFFEAQARQRTFLHGTLVRTQENMFFHSSLVTDPALQPTAVIRFITPPPGSAP